MNASITISCIFYKTRDLRATLSTWHSISIMNQGLEKMRTLLPREPLSKRTISARVWCFMR